MKKLNSLYFTVSVYALAVIAVLFLFGFLCFNFPAVWETTVSLFRKIAPILYGIVFALLLLPLAKIVEKFFLWVFRKKKRREKLARVFSILVTYILVVAFLFVLILSVVPSFTGFSGNVQNITVEAIPTVRPLLADDMLLYVSDVANVGGITGINNGMIRQCYATESISVTGISTISAGGITGFNSGQIYESFAVDDVSVRSNKAAYSGGLIGQADPNLDTDSLRNNFRYSGQLIAAEGASKYERADGELVILSELQKRTFLEAALNWQFYDPQSDMGAWVENENSLPTLHTAKQENATLSAWNGTLLRFSDNAGTEEDPILIRSASELAYLADFVNGGNDTEGVYFRLTCDISLENREWTPIGNVEGRAFRGVFLGDGHTVSGLSAPKESRAFGLFGYSDGLIADLHISGLNISIAQGSSLLIGGLAAVNNGTVENCHAVGQMHTVAFLSDVTAGTLIGRNNGYVTRSSALGFATAISGTATVGGLVGENTSDGLISSSYAYRESENNPFFSFLGSSLSSLIASTIFSTETLAMFATQLTGNLVSVASTFVVEIANFFLGLIISIYLLIDGKKISNILGKILCSIFKRSTASTVSLTTKHLYINVCEFISARVFMSFLAGVAAFVYGWLFDLPMFSILALFLMVAHIFPIIGPILSVAVFVSLVLLLRGPTTAFLALVLFLGAEIVLGRIVAPMLLRKHLRPNFGAKTAVVLVGSGLFGVTGNLIAIPVFAALRLNWNHFLQSVLRKKGLPVTADEYAHADLTKEPFASETEPDTSETSVEIPSDGQQPEAPAPESEE